MSYQEFTNLTLQMRNAQRAYFANRTTDNLENAKRLEAQVDKILRNPVTQDAAKPVRQDQAQWLKETLTKLNLWKKKEDLVREFSMTDATRIAELTEQEFGKLASYLEDLLVKAENQRKTLLSLGYQLHWDTPQSDAEAQMEPKRINYNRVNAWCMSSHSKYKKSLNRLDPFELTETVTQLKQIVEQTRKQANEQIKKP